MFINICVLAIMVATSPFRRRVPNGSVPLSQKQEGTRLETLFKRVPSSIHNFQGFFSLYLKASPRWKLFVKWKGLSTVQNRKPFMEGLLPGASLDFWAYVCRSSLQDKRLNNHTILKNCLSNHGRKQQFKTMEKFIQTNYIFLLWVY